MSFDRVIQDSDDEDEEPYGEPSPEQAKRVRQTNDEALQLRENGIEAQEPAVSHDSHIGVNFDAFLQSPNAPQRTFSASQQAREERWIPDAVPRRVGSMGNVMTEIGLAQQRLFDDEQQAQYAHEQAAFSAQEPVQDTANYEMTVPEDMAEPHDLPTAPVEQDPIPGPEPQQMDPSDDWSQSVSNNPFDSASHTPSGQLKADFLRDSVVTAQTEPIQHAEFRRWASMMQAAASSPHDTEPFSSVMSPKAARAKSDNAVLNPIQQSSASIDELALPVTTELPKLEKRGRKKKQQQPVPANDEDDELAHPESPAPQPSKPEKRKPGRPPKNAKAPVEKNVNVEPVVPIEPESADLPLEVNQGVMHENAEIYAREETGDGVIPQNIVDEQMIEDQIEPPALLVPEQNAQQTPNPTKESKKKKLTRGKTTSVTLTNTHYPDAEDDVIWIDDRPVATTHEDKAESKPNEPVNNGILEPTPAPKKRGRKRKKTAEQFAEESAAPAETEAQVSHEDNQLPPDEAFNEADVSVVLNGKENTRTQTPGFEETQEEQAHPDALEILQQPTSPTKDSAHSEPEQPPETPQKRTDPQTPATKGPGKHSPISSTSKVPYRVGLSKRARIAPLLKIIKR